MKDLYDVVTVKATKDYQLMLKFENGEDRLFDMSHIINKRPFDRLKGSIFMAARVEYGTVVWPGNIDIAPETLYDRSIPLSDSVDSGSVDSGSGHANHLK